MPYEVFVGKKIYIMYNVSKVLEKQVFTLLIGKIDEHNIMKGVCEYLKTLTKIHKCATPWPSNSGKKWSEMCNKRCISMFSTALYIIWNIAKNLDVNSEIGYKNYGIANDTHTFVIIINVSLLWETSHNILFSLGLAVYSLRVKFCLLPVSVFYWNTAILFTYILPGTFFMLQ